MHFDRRAHNQPTSLRFLHYSNRNFFSIETLRADNPRGQPSSIHHFFRNKLSPLLVCIPPRRGPPTLCHVVLASSLGSIAVQGVFFCLSPRPKTLTPTHNAFLSESHLLGISEKSHGRRPPLSTPLVLRHGLAARPSAAGISLPLPSPSIPQTPATARPLDRPSRR